MFGHRTHHTSTTTRRHRRGGLFRKDPDRVAGGYKAALANPNTSSAGRRHAKHELRAMGRGREAHVGIMTRIRRALHIRKTPRSKRHHTHTTTTHTTRRRHVY